MSIGNIGIIKVNEDGSKNRKIPTGGYLTGYTRPYKVIHEELILAPFFICLQMV